MKHLSERKDTKQFSVRWSLEVRRKYGPYCFLHRLRNPHSKVIGSEAAHVIKRSHMGSGAKIWVDGKKVPLAFADVRLGRPLCHDCHVRQDSPLEPDYDFPLEVRIEAVLVHNDELNTTVKLPVPTE